MPRSLPLLLCSLLLALSSAPAESISEWSTVVLDKTLHLGDSNVREFYYNKPQARAFTGTFEFPDSIKPNIATILYVNIDVAGVSHAPPAVLVRLRKFPEQSARLFINGHQAALLNELAKPGSNNYTRQKMTVRLAGKMLVPGRNKIEIIPGRGNQIDDIELFRISVSGRAE